MRTIGRLPAACLALLVSLNCVASEVSQRAASLCNVIQQVANDFVGVEKTPDMRQNGPGYRCTEKYFGDETQCWFRVPNPGATRKSWWILIRWEFGDLSLATQQRDAFAAALNRCRFQLEDDVVVGEDIAAALHTSARSQRLFIESSTADRGMVLLMIHGEPNN